MKALEVIYQGESNDKFSNGYSYIFEQTCYKNEYVSFDDKNKKCYFTLEELLDTSSPFYFVGEHRTFNQYLILVGIRSVDFTWSDEDLFSSIDYFRLCYHKGMSAYKAVLMSME